MKLSIFYSWQSDAPDECNRSFIRQALNEAVTQIGEGADVVDSPRVESGMEGVPGTQEVAQTMFDKIDRSDLFLGDVTLLGNIKPLKKGNKKKPTPNPNVLTELGYAAARIGWGRIICVMNEHYGKRTGLPFDLKSKRHPIDYTLNPAIQDDKNIRKTAKELSKWIRKAIFICKESVHEGVKDAISRLDILCLIVCSVYRNAHHFRDLGQDPTNREALSSIIDVPAFRTAILRLLDLRLLTTDTHSGLYAYHWSYRGALALKELALRRQLQPIREAVQAESE